MKVRTKEENAAYSRLLRARRRVAPSVAPVNIVAPNVSPIVSPVAPDDKDMVIKILRAKLLAAERQVELMKRDRQGEGAKPSPYKFGPEWQR